MILDNNWNDFKSTHDIRDSNIPLIKDFVQKVSQIFYSKPMTYFNHLIANLGNHDIDSLSFITKLWLPKQLMWLLFLLMLVFLYSLFLYCHTLKTIIFTPILIVWISMVRHSKSIVRIVQYSQYFPYVLWSIVQYSLYFSYKLLNFYNTHNTSI